jgi:cytochrome c oxidase cbb3-type subunit 2
MKSGLIFILGLMGALAFSWAGIVMGTNTQLGALPPYQEDNDSAPAWFPGVAARGQAVYRDLGCANCHTQQVRRPDFGSDVARGWGERQSVARDYIYQPYPQLGSVRVGPDLTNLAGRKPSAPDEEDLMKLLYAGHGGMPAYRFLFERKAVVGEVSEHALKLTGSAAPPRGYEIVPTPRAQMLVAYLRCLNTTEDYPEAMPIAAPGGEGEGGAAKGKAAAPAKPGMAPAAGGAKPDAKAAAPAAGAKPATPAAGAKPDTAAPAPAGTAAPAAAPAPASPATPPAPAKS